MVSGMAPSLKSPRPKAEHGSYFNLTSDQYRSEEFLGKKAVGKIVMVLLLLLSSIKKGSNIRLNN